MFGDWPRKVISVFSFGSRGESLEAGPFLTAIWAAAFACAANESSNVQMKQVQMYKKKITNNEHNEMDIY